MEFIGFSEETTKCLNVICQTRNSFKNTFSQPGNLLCGAPQGSILGPLLFLYINDMSQAVDCELLLYVGDTCSIFQHKDITEIETALNKNFSILCDWFVDNKLFIFVKYSFW